MKILVLVLTALIFVSAPQQQQSPTSSDALSEANRLHALLVKLYGANQYDEALPIAKKVLQIRETVLDPNDERIAAAVVDLAAIYEAQKKFGEAERALERALDLYEKKFGPEHAKVAGVLDRLAVVYFTRLKFSESEKTAQRSLAVSEKVFGADSLEIAHSLHNLAQFYRYRNPRKSEPYYDRALMIMRKRLPFDDKTTEKLIEDYSCLYHETGQRDKIKELGNKYLADELKRKPGIPIDNVLNGKAIRLPKPEYSAEAHAARAQGIVIIKVVIDEKGKVIEARDMCGGNPILAKASIASALKAEFTPTKISGQPVKVTGVITYNFVRSP